MTYCDSCDHLESRRVDDGSGRTYETVFVWRSPSCVVIHTFECGSECFDGCDGSHAREQSDHSCNDCEDMRAELDEAHRGRAA